MNWKLAEEAFMEQYHVLETHPQLRIPGRYPPRDGSFDPRRFVESELHYLRVMSEGMAGMVHASDVRVAEAVSDDVELPADPLLARSTWDRTLNDAVVAWHRGQGHDIPDLNELEAQGFNEPMGYCFPHFFVLPMYSSASSYRFRPLGPEETLMEIWSLTRFAEGSETAPAPDARADGSATIPGCRRSPRRTSRTCRVSSRGSTTRGSSTCACPSRSRDTSRTTSARSTASSPDPPTTSCCPALQRVNVNPLEMPIVDIDVS